MTTAVDTLSDPIAWHVAALDRTLRGPRAIRRSMVDEVREGLHDAAAAYRSGGLDQVRAAEHAVRDFGAVHEVAPMFQDELTARQGRRTALVFAIVFPAMLFGWDLMWSTGLVTRKFSGETPPTVSTLASLQDVMTAIIGVAAVLAVVSTFRRSVSPRRLTAAVGALGMFGAVVCGGTSILMNVVGWHGMVEQLRHPAAWFAFGVSILVLVLVICTALRALRLARVP